MAEIEPNSPANRLAGGVKFGLRYAKIELAYAQRMTKEIVSGNRELIAGLSAMFHGMIENTRFAYEELVANQPVLSAMYKIINKRLFHPDFGRAQDFIDVSTPDGQRDYAQFVTSEQFLVDQRGFAQSVYLSFDRDGGLHGNFVYINTRQGNKVLVQGVFVPLTEEERPKFWQQLQEGRKVGRVEVAEDPVLGQQLQIDSQSKAIGVEDINKALQTVLSEDRKQELADYFRKLETEMGLVEPRQFSPGAIWPRIDLGIISGGAGIGMGDVHLGSVHEGVSVTEASVYTLPVIVADMQPHPRGGVETVIQEISKLTKPPQPVAAVQVEMHKEHKNVKAEKFVPPQMTRMIPVNEEVVDSVVAEGVSVTEMPVYALPVVVADAQPHPRGGVERATIQVEKRQEHKSVRVEKVMVPVVTMIDVHLGSGHGEVSVSEVLVYTLPVVVAPVASDFRIEEGITEITEVTEGIEKVVAPAVTKMTPVSEEITQLVTTDQSVFSVIEEASGVIQDNWVELARPSQPITAIQVEKRQEHKSVMQPHPRGGVEIVAEVVVPTMTRMIPVNEEVTVEPQPVVVNQVDQEERHRKLKSVKIEKVKRKAQKIIFSDFNEQVIERKQYQSVKAKIVWLQRHITNMVADQLIGRRSDPNLGWLVHGWAMMRFDGIEQKQEVKRFSLSPVRIWADRVTRVARRVKDKFVRIGFGVYKQLFATI